jgi:hypothetical protein
MHKIIGKNGKKISWRNCWRSRLIWRKILLPILTKKNRSLKILKIKKFAILLSSRFPFLEGLYYKTIMVVKAIVQVEDIDDGLEKGRYW